MEVGLVRGGHGRVAGRGEGVMVGGEHPWTVHLAQRVRGVGLLAGELLHRCGREKHCMQ